MSYDLQEDWQQFPPAWRDLQIHKCLCTMKGLIEQLSTGGSSTLVYRALLSQSGTNAPTAIVLENTLGETPTFSYDSDGNYFMNTVGNVFTTNKTFILVRPNPSPDLTIQFGATWNTENEIILTVMNTFSGAGTNGELGNTEIQILIYP